MPDLKSILVAVETCIAEPFEKLPKRLRVRVQDEFFPFEWESLDEAQRRAFAIYCDAQNDSALERRRVESLKPAARRRDLAWQIDAWQSMPVSDAQQQEIKEAWLKGLRGELRRLTPKRGSVTDVGEMRAGYIAYPLAAAILKARLSATPDEIAAWIFRGPDDGGLAAYRNVNEMSPPRRFFYDWHPDTDGDYVSPLMGCWFLKSDIEAFQPSERYITGTALLARWDARVSKPRAFVVAKIQESRLCSTHPIYGLTREMLADDEEFPPLDLGLFAESEVRQIEREDLPPEVPPFEGIAATPATASSACAEALSSTVPTAGSGIALPSASGGAATSSDGDDSRPPVGSPEWRRWLGRKAANARHGAPGGYREKAFQVRQYWATGRFRTRRECAEFSARRLGIALGTAINALKGAPTPQKGLYAA